MGRSRPPYRVDGFAVGTGRAGVWRGCGKPRQGSRPNAREAAAGIPPGRSRPVGVSAGVGDGDGRPGRRRPGEPRRPWGGKRATVPVGSAIRAPRGEKALLPAAWRARPRQGPRLRPRPARLRSQDGPSSSRSATTVSQGRGVPLGVHGPGTTPTDCPVPPGRRGSAAARVPAEARRATGRWDAAGSSRREGDARHHGRQGRRAGRGVARGGGAATTVAPRDLLRLRRTESGTSARSGRRG